MNFILVGGNTNWSKVLIKNFKKLKNKLKYTSSRYILKKNNIYNYKNIPLKNIDFIVLCSDAKRNIEAASYFQKKNLPIFIEKPISNSYNSYFNFKNKTNSNNIFFCNYLHIYSDPLKFLKKKLKNEKIKSIKLYFGKKGLERNINSSYEWLPHPLSILFFLTNKNYLDSKIVFHNFENKRKTNLIITCERKNFQLYIKTGNNFASTKYILKIITKKNNYIYNGQQPKNIVINKKLQKFSNLPLENSIITFLKIIKKNKNLFIENKKITKQIMEFLYKKKL